MKRPGRKQTKRSALRTKALSPAKLPSRKTCTSKWIARRRPAALGATSFTAKSYSAAQRRLAGSCSSGRHFPFLNLLPLMAEISYREAVRHALAEEIERDPNVVVMGEEVAEYDGAYKVTEGLWKKYGDKRVVDTPISEAAFIGMGVGASMLGLRP